MSEFFLPQKSQKVIKRSILSVFLTSTLMMGGCASFDKDPKPQYQFTANDYIQANREAPAAHGQLVTPPSMPNDPNISLLSPYQSPAVAKAFKDYVQTGQAKIIQGNGFVKYPYGMTDTPIVYCFPMQLCQFTLQKGEAITGISLGDSQRWKYAKTFYGTGKNLHYVVQVKPVGSGFGTDMTIATDRRIYNITLVSPKDLTNLKSYVSEKVSWWYPQDMVENEQEAAVLKNAKTAQANQNTVASYSGKSVINLNKINFNYSIEGDSPAWRPTRVFDDGDKTFIEMPSIADRSDLPVLYIYKNGEQAMVNYRYKHPYFIVDGIFYKFALISGAGGYKDEVDVINHNFA